MKPIIEIWNLNYSNMYCGLCRNEIANLLVFYKEPLDARGTTLDRQWVCRKCAATCSEIVLSILKVGVS